jgi:hypothetical protein
LLAGAEVLAVLVTSNAYTYTVRRTVMVNVVGYCGVLSISACSLGLSFCFHIYINVYIQMINLKTDKEKFAGNIFKVF